jgi:Ran GTPase-activating protein (RanGAP) involved in mRNA processing and transport
VLKTASETIDLRVIKLENAGIYDSQVCLLIDSLMASDKPRMLVDLSLAKNNITDVGADKISQFLDYSGNLLHVLNLHWNKVKFRGGLRLAESLKNNDSLKVLDLSWNLIGKWELKHLGQVPVSEVKKRLNNQI